MFIFPGLILHGPVAGKNAVLVYAQTLTSMKRYTAAQLDTIPGVPCPWGTARRAFDERMKPLRGKCSVAR